uniref:NADH dehydrogenase [ubiquinone] 1 beta subcomplex subunit 9 n=1 Tax=Cyprinus carpio TaxID=7962 RepID=A0A8C1LB42_CYPCA
MKHTHFIRATKRQTFLWKCSIYNSFCTLTTIRGEYNVPEWCLDHWHPSEKAMYPDYFAKREQWKKLRVQSWDKEVQQLQTETHADGPKSEALPPAHKEGDLPPLWWQFVTRSRERPM